MALYKEGGMRIGIRLNKDFGSRLSRTRRNFEGEGEVGKEEGRKVERLKDRWLAWMASVRWRWK
jgi:hypothetical protein